MGISGYTIQRTISKGAMGIVYFATLESIKRDVVLKTMSVNDADSTEFDNRFLNKGRIVARLRHQHIITIKDVATLIGDARASNHGNHPQSAPRWLCARRQLGDAQRFRTTYPGCRSRTQVACPKWIADRPVDVTASR